jgi:hypothetical protein
MSSIMPSRRGSDKLSLPSSLIMKCRIANSEDKVDDINNNGLSGANKRGWYISKEGLGLGMAV